MIGCSGQSAFGRGDAVFGYLTLSPENVMRSYFGGGLTLFLSLAASPCASADKVDDYIRTRMQKQRIPALSLAVVRDGKIIKTRGYGFANLELNTPASSETVYQMASVTKQFVATAMMLLVQDRKISLEDKISTYVEFSPDTWKEITIRHLLTHTSGITNHLNLVDEDAGEGREDTTPEKIIHSVIGLPLEFAPGEKWSYSNTNYVLLSIIVHRVSGKPYDAFLEERVFKPLGMEATRRSSLDEIISNRAAGYVWATGRMRNSIYLNPTLWDNGDGGMLSTALDLAKWDAALYTDRILTASSREQMWTPVKLNNGAIAAYGFGWRVEEVRGHRCIYHTGGRPGTSVAIYRYVDDKLTVIALTNGGGGGSGRIAFGVAGRYLPTLFPRRQGLTIAPGILASCTGYYNFIDSQTLAITAEKGRLVFWVDGKFYDEFIPISKTRFASEETDREFSTAIAANGEVTRLTFQSDGRETAIPRIGPLLYALGPQTDPDPPLTQKVETVLHALGQDAQVRLGTLNITSGMRMHFTTIPELVRIQSLSFLTAQDVSDRQTERYGGKVIRVLGYKAVTDKGNYYVLIYLTAEGLVTGVDIVDH